MADNIVGYLKIDCLGGVDSTDTIVSVPFQKSGVIQGRLDGATMAVGETTLVFPAGIATAGEFTASPHYVLFKDGAAAGRSFPVTSNTTQNVVINTGTETLTGVATDDIVKVVSYWTLQTLLPFATQTAIHVSSGVLPNQRATEVLFFDTTSDGIQLSPDRVFFVTATGWKQAAEGYPDAADAVIAPGAALVIRHSAGAVDTEFLTFAAVEQGDVASVLRSTAGSPQDNTLSLMRPVPTEISEIDLEGFFTVSDTDLLADRKDELFVFGTTSGTVNTFPTTKYFRKAAGWFEDDGATFPSADTAVIPAGSAVVIRKASSGAADQIWVNQPRY